MTELKPCPFCGGEAEIRNLHWGGCVGVGCKECTCIIYADYKTEAIRDWNKRYEPRTPGGAYVPARNERLKGGK